MSPILRSFSGLSFFKGRRCPIEKRLMVAKGEGVRGGMEWGIGVSRCELLYIEWINKVLLYSTENYIQYPMINHNGKEYERMYAYV